MHERRRIRELVVAILTADAQSLFSHPVTVSDSPALPITTARGVAGALAIRVYLTGDTRVGDTREKQDPCTYLRNATLEVQCITEATQTWNHAHAVDGFTEEVEAVLAKYLSNNLNNTVQGFEYAETDVEFTGEEGEKIYALATLRYDVQFRTTAWEVHPDLAGADIDYALQEARDTPHLEPPHAVDTADV